jgi:hypothetical protein
VLGANNSEAALLPYYQLEEVFTASSTAVTENLLFPVRNFALARSFFPLPLDAWLLIMLPATSLRENTILLNFTIKAL